MSEVLKIIRSYDKNIQSMLLSRKLGVADEEVKKAKKEKWWQRNKKKVVTAVAAVGLLGVIATYLIGRESPEEIRRREGMAKFQPITSLYQDALNDKNPESSLAKLIILAEQAKDFREEYPNIEREYIGDVLSTTGQKIPSLTKTVQRNKIEKEGLAKYNSLKRSFQLSFEDENKGELEKAAAGYENIAKQLKELRKQYPNVRFMSADELLEKVAQRAKGLTEKVIVQKYDKELPIMQEIIDKCKYDDARRNLEKLLAKVENENKPELLARVKKTITEMLARVNKELSSAEESTVFAPLKERYDTALSTEKAHKLINAKTLYEKLIEDCQKTPDFESVKQLLVKIKGKPQQLHKDILDYALEGKLEQTHKQIVEYMISATKQLEEPSEKEPLSKLEERKKLYEIIMTDMARWKVTQMEDSLKGLRKDVFPEISTGKQWELVKLTEPSGTMAYYPELLSLAYDITRNERFLKEFKLRANEIIKLLNKKFKNPDSVDNLPDLFDSCLDLYERTKNPTYKNAALRALDKFIYHITSEGFFKYPSDKAELIIDAHLNNIGILLRASEIVEGKKGEKYLKAAEKMTKGSLEHQYNPKKHAINCTIENKKGTIKPEHTEIFSAPQMYAMEAYTAAALNESVNDKLRKRALKTAMDLADNYMGFIKQNIKDYIPEYGLEQGTLKTYPKDSHNVRAINNYLNLAELIKEKEPEKAARYTKFAKTMMYHFVVEGNLNTSEETQGILKHCVMETFKDRQVSSIQGALHLLDAFRRAIQYYQEKIQQLKQEQKQQEKGTMHESNEPFFRRHAWQIPKRINPAKHFNIPRRKYMFA